MQADINEPKSRAFNLYLRFLHFGLSLAIAVNITQINANLSATLFSVASITAYGLIAFNLIAIIYLRCKDRFPKVQFFVSVAVDLAVCAVVLVVSFASIGQTENNANLSVASRYTVFAVPLVVTICLLIVFLPFHWIQRYSNSPGNFVWFCTFVGYTWTGTISGQMMAICLLNLLINVLTLLVNIIAKFKGATSGVKKAIMVAWILGLIIMLICQIIGIASYFQITNSTLATDLIAKSLLLIFLALNFVDALFWLFGMLTLHYENGDKIRDSLLTFGQNSEYAEEEQRNAGDQFQSEPNTRRFGTIK